MQVKFKHIHEHLKMELPSRGTDKAAGLDLRACFAGEIKVYHATGTHATGTHTLRSTPVSVLANLAQGNPVSLVLHPGDRALVPTGFTIELPPGHEGQVRSRSGLALKEGIAVLNSPGTIDEDYRGPLGVILVNNGHSPYTLNHGDRIAQLVVAPVIYPEAVEATDLSDSVRGAGGFGSTGVK